MLKTPLCEQLLSLNFYDFCCGGKMYERSVSFKSLTTIQSYFLTKPWLPVFKSQVSFSFKLEA